ncbi:MAG: NfeD family protein [Candidatus Methanomethylophilaceae archaeon]|nr:NfeD family protein [Candidatus Methanomethylophilaceae archaeon]
MVDASSIALSFMVLGVILLIVEASSPGAFIVIPGTVLLILGAIGLLYPDIFLSWYAPLIALVIMLPTTVLTIRFYQKLAPPEPPETTVNASLIGREGLVTSTIMPGSIRGKVRISNDTWSATSSEEIEVGAKVRVVSSEGVHVKVERSQ